MSALKEKASLAHALRKPIKATNMDTNEVHTFTSKSKCAKYYGISPALVYLICRGLKNKSANTAQGKITFEYADPDQMDGRIDVVIAPPEETIECTICHKMVKKSYEEKHKKTKIHVWLASTNHLVGK